MSKTCDLLREALKDENDAIPFYNKLKTKMIGNKNNTDTIDKIISDEINHHTRIKKIANELGCNCQ